MSKNWKCFIEKGFFEKKPDGNEQIYNSSTYIREYDFLGMVIEYNKETKIAKIEQRNRMLIGDEIEILNPDGSVFKQKINNMKNEDMEDIETAPHPQMTVYMKMEQDVCPYSMLRKKVQG